MYIIDIVRLSACILVPRTLRVPARHSHLGHELHYVIAGRASFELAGRRLEIKPGDCFYTKPGTMHQMEVSDGAYLLQYIALLKIDPVADHELAEDLDTSVGEGRILRLGDRYHASFAQISLLSLSDDPRLRRAATARMEAFLYDMMVGVPSAHVNHPAVERALEFMRSHVDVAFDLDDLVAGIGLDKSYFIRLFKKSIGVPPMKYATNLKMSAASDLLRTTSEPLATVAARVGFDDEYHFAKRFKKWSGMAPGRYRKQDHDEGRLA